jgi:hypothetical protein
MTSDAGVGLGGKAIDSACARGTRTVVDGVGGRATSSGRTLTLPLDALLVFDKGDEKLDLTGPAFSAGE